MPHSLYFLIHFVPFAGDQHDITMTGFGDGVFDGTPSVRFDLALAVHPGEDVVDNEPWVFVARVIVGEHYLVRQPCRDPAHQRPLAAIALAATAENTNE